MKNQADGHTVGGHQYCRILCRQPAHIYGSCRKGHDSYQNYRNSHRLSLGGSAAGDDNSPRQCQYKAEAFYREGNIDREVWKKGIINTVFNSVCPLLDTDNGVFERDADAMAMAECLVKECVPVAQKINISIEVEEILEQILAISKRSSGQLISTLQDIRGNRETEIRFFNLEICRVARNLPPPIELPLTRTLGLLTLKRSEIAMKRFVGGGKV